MQIDKVNTRLGVTALVRYAVLIGALLAPTSGCGASMPASVKAWRSGLSVVTTPDGQQLGYVDAGPRDGEVILLLHGLPTNSFLYRQVVPALTARGYRVVVPDLVGFGASSKPVDEATYAFGLQADRLLALADQLHAERFSMVVHDLGGLVGWELLGKQPRRVARLLVLNTTAYAEFRPPVQMRMLAGPMGGVMSAMMAGGTFGRSLTGTFIKDNTGDPAKVDDATVDNFWWPLHEGATVPVRAMARTFGRVAAEFPRYQAALRRFTGPAMVLWGTRDHVLAYKLLAPRFAADLRIPADRVRAIADAGHFVMLDRPEVVRAAILDLMALPITAAVSDDALRAPEAGVPQLVVDEAPGPSLDVAVDLTDRIATDPRAHDVRVGLRGRTLLGARPGYAIGLDANIGSASGLAYRVAAYPIGVGYAHGGHMVALTAGVGVHAARRTSAQLEVPVSLDVGLPIGPVRALGWAHVSWIDAADLPWEAALGVRLGRGRRYFPGAFWGSGPYLAAILGGAGALRSYGLALGFEISDGR